MTPIGDPLALLPGLAGMPTGELDALIVALAEPELRPTPAHDLARAHALGARFDRDQDPAILATAVRVYQSCPYRGRARGLVGRGLALRRLHAGLRGQPVDLAEVRAMVDDAGDDPVMPGSAALLRTMADVLAAYADDPAYDRTEALRRLDDLAGAIPPESPTAWLVRVMRTALAVKRAGVIGSYGDATAAAGQARDLLSRDDLTPTDRAMTEAMLAGAVGLGAAQRGEMDGFPATVEAMSAIVGKLPAGYPAGPALRQTLSELDGSVRPEDADGPGPAPAERAWRLLVAATHRARSAMDRQDPAGVVGAIELLRRADRIAPGGYQHRPLILTQLGQLLTVHYQLGGGRPVLGEAIRRLSTAREEMGHPGHPVWTFCAMVLGLAYRLDGRPARSRTTGLQALRGHAWSVLLQAGTADAVAAARHAADDARQVARWCLADGEPATAALALDAGRCLMLYAATVEMDVPARLAGLGREDLLARWRGDATDPDLRAEVLTVLTGATPSDAAVPETLDPPDVAEIGSALSASRADVLVYLIPPDDPGTGGALLVPSSQLHAVRPAFLPLPRLTAGGRVAAHVDALGLRDAGAADADTAGGDWRAGLDRLCDWAWPAVIGPLLDTLDRWPIGRAPRMVLVPLGDLAAVPWHAARDRDGTRAVEVATFSYAGSARLLCQNAGRPPVAAEAPALIVADPDGDLPDARAEAGAIRAAFLPSATLLEGGEATSGAVRGWLAAGGGAVLHLACHGTVRAGVDGSFLSLGGGRLTAHDILRGRRTTEIGLVALAACTTGVPSGAYDEAFSLTTAFLVAGTRSVFGSLWAVPSDSTSLLMFMAHHYLWAEGKRPVDALNHAQRWMLNPDRKVPPTMPVPLRALLTGPIDDVTAWAGLTHQGC
ncbi:CHAT domain-containing protein [Actinoplanes sp. NPDC049265]|uniref:CHAT domain-containing protein n=1 Tax=Actinoplanes sp. NPDC049265 TaxID=3363902 RepID=UPI0037141BD4